MNDIGQLLERGFTGGIVAAAALIGFAGCLYVVYRLIKSICPDCQGKGLRLKKLPLLKVDVGKVCKTCGGSGYLPTYASDFIEIPADNIIKESRTDIPGYCDKQYIVYISPVIPRKKIRVNTDYLLQGDKVRLCTHYDRGLCDTLEEYNKLPIEYIEEQVYGSWMDGAR